MPLKIKAPDVVTTEYIEAHRLGVLVRTPLENIAFFAAEDKSVAAYTKTNGAFVLQIPLHKIEDILKGRATAVHRSYVVMNETLPGLKNWRKGSHWVFEVTTSVRMGDRVGLLPHIIPISRKLTQQVKAAINANTDRAPE